MDTQSNRLEPNQLKSAILTTYLEVTIKVNAHKMLAAISHCIVKVLFTCAQLYYVKYVKGEVTPKHLMDFGESLGNNWK